MTSASNDTLVASTGRAGAWTGLVSALAYIGIIFVSGLLYSGEMPRPDDPAEDTQQFFADNASLVEVGAFVRVAASLLLVAFCVVAADAVRRLEPRAGASSGSVVAGGALAAIASTVSVVFGIALTQVDGTGSLAVTDALRQVNFLTGGAGYTVWLGLVVGPLCIVLRRVRAVPDWLSAAGVLSGAFALLASLSLMVEATMLFIPLGRFSALLVIAAVSVGMATGRVRPNAYAKSTRATILGGIGLVVAAMVVTIFI